MNSRRLSDGAGLGAREIVMTTFRNGVTNTVRLDLDDYDWSYSPIGSEGETWTKDHQPADLDDE